MNDATILVVEDEAIVAANIEMRLQSLGYHVPIVVDNGTEALEVVASTHPDLVLMDIRIAGDLDGIATADLIRTRYAIPVIYLTAYTDDETVQRARQTEPYGYILKPFEVGELRTAIELALFRHSSERQRRTHEQWFATTLRSISDAVITTDTQGLVTYMNPAAEALLGCGLGSAVARPIGEILTLADAASGAPLAPLAPSSWAGAEGGAQQALVRASGELIPVESRVAPIRDDRSSLLGAVLVLRDMRERLATEARLRLIEAAVQQTDELIMLLSTDQASELPRITFANQSFARLTGYHLDDVIGKTPALLYGPGTSPTLVEQIERAFREGWPATGEGLAYGRDGNAFQAEWTITPLRDPRGRISRWVAVLRDVTSRRRDQEIRHQRQKLESLGVLAGGIAHDFNNLLAVVLGNASMALLELPSDSPIRELLTPIESAARRAATLTRQMLAYAGHDRLRAQSLDLNHLVRETVAASTSTMPNGIELQTRLDPGLPLLFADVAQIRRVLRNLINNAVEAIGEQPGTILVTTSRRRLGRDEIAATYLAPNLPPGDYLCMAVQDNGAGMDADVLARLFEPFFTTRFAGRGLGMAEVLGIISAHQGTIKVESLRDRGTTVTIALPVGSKALDFALEDATLLQDGALAERELLLVLEHDEGTAQQIAQTLRTIGFAVAQAQSPDAAEAALRGQAGELRAALIDGGLPATAVRELVARLQQSHAGVTIILMSARNGTLPVELTPLAGHLLQRPCSPDELRAAVLRALGRYS